MQAFKNLVIAILLLSGTTIKAQVDPHFSQYYAYPLYLNPALTGASKADFRATAIYRNQWSAYGKPYETKGLSADITTEQNLAFGLNILKQTAGDGGYSFTNAMFSVAYTGIRFNEDGSRGLVMALQGGFMTRSFDLDKLRFGNQWLPFAGYTSALSSNEVFDRSRSSVFDANAGITYYDGNPEKKVNTFAGLSVAHLTQPEDPFLFGERQKLPMRVSIHGGAKIMLSETTSIVPNFLFMKQGTAQEKMLGAYVELNADRAVQLLAGANIRFGDAYVPFAGITFSGMTIGMSYDANASKQGKITGKADSFEISLTFKKSKTGNEFFKCPTL